MKNIDVIVKKDEEKVVPVVWCDDQENEIHITARLTGDNSSLTILGMFLGTRNNKIVFTTDVTHEALHTKSLTKLRAVFLDHAAFNNDGMIRIKKGAKNANGFFDSKVLLFDNAKGRSVPSLEIDENEVKAGHGSTIGRPDRNQIIYMQSRGISEKEAEKLIITGFFDPVMKMLSEKEKVATKNILSNQLKLIILN